MNMDNRNQNAPVVLLVDDEASALMAISEWLRDEGYTVIEATCAAEARSMLHRFPGKISVMVTDVVMPGDMDGIELADWTREHHPEVRVILISGWIGGRDTGVHHELIPKPYKLSYLADRVRELMVYH